MILKMLTVYDSKAECYNTPIFAPTTAVALRMFRAACNEETNEFNKYSSDYQLFEIGEFDQDTCEFRSHNTPIALGMAQDFIDPEVEMPTPIRKEN